MQLMLRLAEPIICDEVMELPDSTGKIAELSV